MTGLSLHNFSRLATEIMVANGYLVIWGFDDHVLGDVIEFMDPDGAFMGCKVTVVGESFRGELETQVRDFGAEYKLIPIPARVRFYRVVAE